MVTFLMIFYNYCRGIELVPPRPVQSEASICGCTLLLPSQVLV